MGLVVGRIHGIGLDGVSPHMEMTDISNYKHLHFPRTSRMRAW